MPQVAALAMSPKVDTPEAIGSELRAALPGMRLHSLSLHDAEGDVVWLSEGVLGPDEHAVVLEAMNGQSLEPSAALVDRPLGDGRNALILPARNAQGDVVGAAMMIVDTKQISGELLRRLASQNVNDALAKLAARQTPAARAAPPAPRPAALQPPKPSAPPRAAVAGAAPRAPAPRVPPTSAAPASFPLELELAPDEPRRLPPPEAQVPTLAAARSEARPTAAAPRAPATARRVAPASPTQPLQAPTTAPAAPAMPAVPAAAPPAAPHVARGAPQVVRAPAGAPKRPAARATFVEPEPEPTLIAPKPEIRDLTLVVQQLLKLRSGGRTRRYEVLLRSRSDPSREAAPATLLQAITAADATSVIDRFVLAELVTWLGRHREVWETDPSSFTVNLSATTLRDRGFLRYASTLLDQCRVAPGVIGFEIPEHACVEGGDDIREFIEHCERLGFFLALDDFSMNSAAVPFLASPAVRLVKIDARLTLAAMKDKLSQAMVIAISQAAKVLGVHCVAKRIESAMARQWLSAIGIDFAQGFALERPQTLDSLLVRRSDPPGPTRA